jgi:lactate racemase
VVAGFVLSHPFSAQNAEKNGHPVIGDFENLAADGSTMKTHFSFGKKGIEVSVPESYRAEVVRSHTAAALRDVNAALAEALDNPIGCESLVKLATGKRTAAISVCDITRPAPNRVTLPPLLERLHRAGIPVEGVTILIATGLHRAATEDEVKTIVGPEIARTYRVESHDARDLASHRALGTTRRGTPVYIDERFVAADLHITLGFVEQHLMLGFSGGRKLIVPGQAAQETIKTVHSPRFMREPKSTEGSIEGNPLHEEFLEIAAMARHDFMLDVTLTQERGISGVFAGNPVKAHAAAVKFIEESSLTTLDEPADVVITSAAGYPLDLTFYQIVKGITAAQHLTKPGGRILLVGECAEGIGGPEFAEGLRTMKGYQAYLDAIRERPVVVDQWQLEKLALVGVKSEIYFYTPGAAGTEMGFLSTQAYGTLDEAVAAALEGLPSDARVALVPEGPYTYARAVPAYV